ncbi:MAG: HD domain-containing protein [Lentisphaeria bacterium]|nr:HD domain-containing protein [Lentisphaeria bacterium]
MTLSAEQLNALKEIVRRKLHNASGCHDFDHTMRVCRNAELLCAELPAADADIVRTAALLHDIARPEEIASKGTTCHAALGSEMVRELLKGRFSEPFVNAVSDAVRTHRFRDGNRPATLEAEIVYDADKLDSLGAVGIGRAFLFAGRENARLHNTAEEALNSPAYSREDTAYREYLVKLQYLPQSMLTAPGKRLAAERAGFMHDFFEKLEKETGSSS